MQIDWTLGYRRKNHRGHTQIQSPTPGMGVLWTTSWKVLLRRNLVGPNPTNSTDQLWTADPNPDFGVPGAIVPKFGSRSFQFSTRFTF
jgi:hypothetical protein